MAANRTVQSLTIAMAVFVMLTFALGVTTYLFFSGQQKAIEAKQEADAKAVAAQTELVGIKDDMEKLRQEIIGVAADMPVADIDMERAALFEGDFAGFTGDQKTYLKLIEWLRGEFRERSTRTKTVEQEKKELEVKTAADLKAAQESLAKAEQAATEAKQALDTADKQFAEARGTHESRQNKLLDEKRTEEEKARDLENLKTLIAGLSDYLPPARQEAVKARPAAEQLEVIRNELRSQTKEIVRLNEVLAAARVAEPAVQAAIADLRPETDRIDGFDGRVADVDARSGTVLVSCRSTAGIRPGLVLHVFPPDEGRPQFGDRKAMIEVTDVEGPSLVRAAIRRETSRDPILSGDGVATSLWGSGDAPAIMIVGFSDVDNDGRFDQDRLTELVTKAGGRVVDGVAANTALVVDLGTPQRKTGDDEIPGWSAEEKRRDRALKTAKVYGTRVGSLDTLLDLLGLDAGSFEVGRLPRGRAVGRLPPRR
jgi:hypothetical protein